MLYPPSWSPFAWPEQTRDGGGRRFRFLFPDGAVPDYNSRDGSSSSPLFLRRLLCIPFFGGRGLVRPTSTCPGGLSCAAALYINRARIHIILHNTRSCQACVCCFASALQRDLFSVPSRRSVFARLNDVFVFRFQLSRSAHDDSAPRPNAGGFAPRCRQPAECRDPGFAVPFSPAGHCDGPKPVLSSY